MVKVIISKLMMLAVLIMILAGCTPRTPSNQKLSPQGAQSGVGTASSVAQKEGWQEIWEKTISAAKKEKKVVIYAVPSPEVRRAVGEAFKNLYGISLEFNSASGPELATKIMAERKAGIYIADILLGASAPGQTILKPAGAFEPIEPRLILPEVKDPGVWWQGKIPWADSDHYRISFTLYPSPGMSYNSGMVTPGELKSYRDLLNPRWKEKMVLQDPTRDTAGSTVIASIAWKFMGVDFLRELAKQEPLVLSDRRLVVQWVAQGKYPLGLGTQEEIVTEFTRAGAPLALFTPQEGIRITGGAGFIGLLDRAPNSDAATVFINWLLTKEAQTIFSKAAGVQSAREDVSTAHLSPHLTRRPGMDYYDAYSEKFWLSTEERQKLGRDYFGQLMQR